MNIYSKRTIKNTLLFAFFSFILIYAFSRSHDILFGIKIKNVNLVDGTTMTDRILHITGNAKNAVNLALNGREISIDQKGNFSETIALLPGYNEINLRALDKFSYTDEKNYKLILAQALGN